MIEYDTAPVLSKCGAVHAFFGTGGGVDGPLNVAKSVGYNSENAAANRKLALKELNLDPNLLVFAGPLGHSDKIKEVGLNDTGVDVADFDALVTNDNVAIALSVADCVPVLMIDPKKNVVAVAHSGWRSSAKNIAAKTVKFMHDRYKTNPSDVCAAIGPCICQKHYEVGEEVASHFSSEFVSELGGSTYLDLAGVNKKQLQDAGVKNVEVIQRCTFEDHELFSHRRDPKSGRMLAVIGLS